MVPLYPAACRKASAFLPVPGISLLPLFRRLARPGPRLARSAGLTVGRAARTLDNAPPIGDNLSPSNSWRSLTRGGRPAASSVRGVTMIRFACPVCKSPYSTPEANAGKLMSCPSCQASVLLPSPHGLQTARAVSLTKLAILFGTIGIVAGSCCAGPLGYFAASKNANGPSFVGQRPAAPMTRAEFEQQAQSAKSRTELISKLGTPDRTLKDGFDRDLWVYERRTHDPATGGHDASATILFGDGQCSEQVESISFTPTDNHASPQVFTPTPYSGPPVVTLPR
jgi:hypothetical protein